jgi:hypothetical protein
MKTHNRSGTYSRSSTVSIPLARSAIAGDGSGSMRIQYSALLPHNIARTRAVIHCRGVSPPARDDRQTVGRVFYLENHGRNPSSSGGLPRDGISPPLRDDRQTVGRVFYLEHQGRSPSGSGGPPADGLGPPVIVDRRITGKINSARLRGCGSSGADEQPVSRSTLYLNNLLWLRE